MASYQSRPFLLLFSKHRPPVGTHTFRPSPPCHLGPGCWRRWSRLNAALGRRRLERQASSRSPEVPPNWLTSGPSRLVGNLAAWFGASLALNRPLTCCFQSRTCRSPGAAVYLSAGADRRHKERATVLPTQHPVSRQGYGESRAATHAVTTSSAMVSKGTEKQKH